MNDCGQLNLDWSAALIGGLVAAGVRDVVLSPGSRSTPLALACLRHPDLRCEAILDERSAAWFALGLAKAGGAPVALLCTSGTAAANWLPAVVEANQSAVPLLLLSADRPPELQGWGANQTIEQSPLFAGQIRAFHAPGAAFSGFDPHWLQQLAARAVAESRWPLPGPVHLNLAFREPLLPADPAVNFPSLPTIETGHPELTPATPDIARLARHLSGKRGVIICGGGNDDPAFAEAIGALALALGCPVLTEPLSNLRFGPHDRSHVCCHHELWLREERSPAAKDALKPEWVLRFGAYPVTRTLQRYLASCATLYLVEAHGRWPDPEHRTRQLLRADPTLTCRALLREEIIAADSGWLRSFVAEETRTQQWLTEAPLPPEARLFATLCRQLPSGTQFFCGNSMSIRDLAAYSGCGDTALRFHANRGASGIDGNIATAAGVAAGAATGIAARTTTAPTLALIGDLTAQHDIGSLALMAKHPLVLIIINNGGGGIFDLLPPATLPEFEVGWLTPQQIDFQLAARAFGIDCERTDDAATAANLALQALQTGRSQLIEFMVDRRQSLHLRQAKLSSAAGTLKRSRNGR